MAKHDDLDECERFLVGEIDRIQEQYQRAIKPYVDRLVQLRSLRPMPPIIIPIEQARALGIIGEQSASSTAKEGA